MPITIQAALLGLVQGVTEFLPVSSTAHLILARAFFGFDADAFGLPFDVACHFGTLVAVLIYFRGTIARMIAALPDLFSPQRNDMARLIWLLVIGTIPAVVVGALFNRAIEDNLRTVPVIAASLAVVALGLFWADRAGAKLRDERTITYGEALVIGCAQAVALIPGVSRSGATLIAALLIGLRRRDAAGFIFLLSVPAILAAAVHETPKALRAMGGMPGEGTLFAIGIVSSAAIGYVAVKYFIEYLTNHSLDPFAWYRLALAAAAVIWLVR